MTASTRVDEFEELRPHLLAVAYRLTGTVADAEDIVQDAWLRWDGSGAEAINDLRAWLTTVVSRLSLDRLRSAAHRRETYFGEWLPEPVVTDAGRLRSAVGGGGRRGRPVRRDGGAGATQPRSAGGVCAARRIRCAVRRDRRRAGVSAAAARQLASRARRAVASAPPSVTDDSHSEVAGALMVALAAGDMKAVVHLLHPDVTYTGDANGKAPTAARVIRGPDKVARFLFGLASRYGPGWLESNQLAMVNGQLGSYTRGAPGSDGYPAMTPRMTAMTVRDGRVCAIWDIANPDKFTGSPLRPDPR